MHQLHHHLTAFLALFALALHAAPPAMTPSTSTVTVSSAATIAFPDDRQILQTFTASTRAASAPIALGQCGLETDTGLLYVADGTAAGDWIFNSDGWRDAINLSGYPSITTEDTEKFIGWVHGDGTIVRLTSSANGGSPVFLDLNNLATVPNTATLLTTSTTTASGLTAGQATAALGLKSATTTVAINAATAPTTGQVLTATSSTAATWQTPTTGVALGDSPTWTGSHTFAGATTNIYDKIALKTTAQPTDATAIEVIADPANPAVRALRILPPANSCRIYLGKSGQAAYALSMQYCASIESCPPVDVTSNGITLGSPTSTSISRSADGTQIGASTPSDGGLTIYHHNSYNSIAAAYLVSRIHRISGISFYGTNTSATVYERVSLAYDSGVGTYFLDTQKGASGGSDRPFEIRTAGTARIKVTALGEIIPVLPTSSAGLPTGALWNDSGTVKVAP